MPGAVVSEMLYGTGLLHMVRGFMFGLYLILYFQQVTYYVSYLYFTVCHGFRWSLLTSVCVVSLDVFVSDLAGTNSRSSGYCF